MIPPKGIDYPLNAVTRYFRNTTALKVSTAMTGYLRAMAKEKRAFVGMQVYQTGDAEYVGLVTMEAIADAPAKDSP